jgi:branched-chain amino acid transport system substrate-binding protein
MGKILNLRSLALSTVLLVGLFFLCPVGANAQGPIKIGIVDTYSGPATTYTYDVRDAFKLAIDEVNAKGGVLKRKIEFTTRDDKFKVIFVLAWPKNW